MSPAPDSSGLRRRLRVALLALGGLAAGIVVLGAASLFAFVVLYEDVGEDHAVVTIQLHGAASTIRQAGLKEFDRELAASMVGSVGEDPWGHAYRIERSPNHARRFRMYSLGADGRPGGEGRDEDLVIWVDLEAPVSSMTYSLHPPPSGFVW